MAEKPRESHFPNVEIRSVGGRLVAYLKGSRLAVWHVALYAESEDVGGIADLLGRRVDEIESALAYADAFPDCVRPFLEEATSKTFDDIKRVILSAVEVRVSDLEGSVTLRATDEEDS